MAQTCLQSSTELRLTALALSVSKRHSPLRVSDELSHGELRCLTVCLTVFQDTEVDSTGINEVHGPRGVGGHYGAGPQQAWQCLPDSQVQECQPG